MEGMLTESCPVVLFPWDKAEPSGDPALSPSATRGEAVLGADSQAEAGRVRRKVRDGQSFLINECGFLGLKESHKST